MRALPNFLTLLRLALIPLIVRAILTAHFAWALGLFGIAGITDGVDGFLARRFGWTSRAGAYLDPVADKVMMAAVYVGLAWIAAVPAWLLVLILGRDVLILAFSCGVLALTRLRNLPPSVWGKLSTFLQIATAVFVLTSLAIPGWDLARFLPAMFVLVAAGTIWSGCNYLWRGLRMLRMRVN